MNEKERQLHQIYLQAEFGKIVAKAISNQLKQGNKCIIYTIPLPPKLCTEDGWIFYLKEDGYESDDGSRFDVTEILDLIALEPEERELETTPLFSASF